MEIECPLCGIELSSRSDIREHVLGKHESEQVYQCQYCDYVHGGTRLFEHVQCEHDINVPLVEKVHFRHLAIGELMKRMSNVLEDEDVGSPVMDECCPSPDSAILLSKDDFDNPSPLPGDLEIPERSPDSGLCGASSGDIAQSVQFDDITASSAPPDPHVRLQRVNRNYQELMKSEEENKENVPVKQTRLEELNKSQSSIDYSEYFTVGQIVWVWLSGHPIWPGMIAESPEHDATPHLAFRGQGDCFKRPQFHCQFFGSRPDRSWISVRAILPWDSDMPAQEQFEKLTDVLKTKYAKGKNKGKDRIKTQIPAAKLDSWKLAVVEAQNALQTFNSDAERRSELTFDYVPPSLLEKLALEIEDTPTPPKAPKITKRKSILPPPQKLTPLDQLDYRESMSAIFDPDLVIPPERIDQKSKDQEIFPELIPGEDFYNVKFSMHESRTISRELAMRAAGALKIKFSDIKNALKSPKKSKKVEAPVDTPNTELKIKETKTVVKLDPALWLGSKGDAVAVCVKCEEEGGRQCQGICKLYYCEQSCSGNKSELDQSLPETESEASFVCNSCKTGSFNCFSCQNQIDNSPEADASQALTECSDKNCGRQFHLTCLQNLKNVVFNEKEKSYKCSHHICHTCATKADSLKSNEHYHNKGKMFQCIRCPSAYHFHGERGIKTTKDDAECVPAGCILLGGINIVCPAHFQPRANMQIHKSVHANHCFECFDGGNLIICDACPAAYHEYCLKNQPNSDGAWFCPDCQQGKLIYYKDIVWAKIGQYRWWPSEVIHPTAIPENVERIEHGPGEFAVRFLGTNDYSWLNQRRVFQYRGKYSDPISFGYYSDRMLYKLVEKLNSTIDDIDRVSFLGETHSKKSTLTAKFKQALLEAEHKFDHSKGIKSNGGSLPFSKIPSNKYYSNFPPDLLSQIKKDLERDLEKATNCNCASRGDDCGEDTHCENRLLQLECPADCKLTEKCQNRKFSKRSYPLLNKVKLWWGGYGLKAKNLIKNGTFIIEYCGELVDRAEAEKRLNESSKIGVTNYYLLSLDKDRLIDAGPRGNMARYINHSCDPNCATEPWIVNGDKRIGIFACKTIQPDEELTFNYQLEQFGAAKTKCLCGAANCAGFIGDKPKDPNTLKKEAKETENGKKPNKKTVKMRPLSLMGSENAKKRGRKSTGSSLPGPKKRKLTT